MNTAAATLFVCLIVLSIGQDITVDATSAVHSRRREPTSGSGGGIGRKLPLAVSIETREAASNDSARAKVEFIITNSGNSNIELPISPNPGDFEPDDPRKPYTLLVLNAFLTADTEKGPEFNEAMLAGGAYLYGERSSPSSIVKLPPGRSIHILAFAALPRHQQFVGSAVKVVAHVELSQETVATSGPSTSAQTVEIGSASSEPGRRP